MVKLCLASLAILADSITKNEPTYNFGHVLKAIDSMRNTRRLKTSKNIFETLC